jgi:hypothetical protein
MQRVLTHWTDYPRAMISVAFLVFSVDALRPEFKSFELYHFAMNVKTMSRSLSFRL